MFFVYTDLTQEQLAELTDCGISHVTSGKFTVACDYAELGSDKLKCTLDEADLDFIDGAQN